MTGNDEHLATAADGFRDEWWYNDRTGEVEHGPQSLGLDRIGPFASREEAARAPEIVAERSRRWAAEDAAEDA